MSDSARPHRWPTRLPRPWDSPGKNTGVGCHFLLPCMKMKSESEVAQSCLTLHDPIVYPDLNGQCYLIRIMKEILKVIFKTSLSKHSLPQPAVPICFPSFYSHSRVTFSEKWLISVACPEDHILWWHTLENPNSHHTLCWIILLLAWVLGYSLFLP